MKIHVVGLLLFCSTCAQAQVLHGFQQLPEKTSSLAKVSDDENFRWEQKRGFYFKAGYLRQFKGNGLELMLTRANQVNYYDFDEQIGISAASAQLGLGSEISLSDTAYRFAPKLSLELQALLIGVRTSFVRYMKGSKATNVISVEGGLCFISILYVYGGYNWAVGAEQLAGRNGAKFAVGLNIPFGMRDHEQGMPTIGFRKRLVTKNPYIVQR
jgi:hypothetical protein